MPLLGLTHRLGPLGALERIDGDEDAPSVYCEVQPGCGLLSQGQCCRCDKAACRHHCAMSPWPDLVCEDCGGDGVRDEGREQLREAVGYMAEQVLLPLAGHPDYTAMLRQVIEQQRELIRRMDETIAKMGVR